MKYSANTDVEHQPVTVNNRRDLAGEQIKNYIRIHRIQPNQKLPSIRALSDHLESSRDATWRALQVLQDEGWIYSLPNRRYAVSESVYKEILRSFKLRAIFSGHKYISFSGFRRLADLLKRDCSFHNLDLKITVVPEESQIPEDVWDNCDMLLVDSDSSLHLLENFEEFPVPVIGLDAAYSNRYQVNIVTNHFQGGHMVAEYMMERGVEKVDIPYFKGSRENPRIKARIDGFIQAWLEKGGSQENVNLLQIPWSENNLELSLRVKDILENHSELHHLFVTDGRLALCFLDVCQYLNISVPDKIGLIGYDGAQVGATCSPPMTTIEQDMDAMAKEAINYIINLTKHSPKKGELIRINPNLVIRDSF